MNDFQDDEIMRELHKRSDTLHQYNNIMRNVCVYVAEVEKFRWLEIRVVAYSKNE